MCQIHLCILFCKSFVICTKVQGKDSVMNETITINDDNKKLFSVSALSRKVLRNKEMRTLEAFYNKKDIIYPNRSRRIWLGAQCQQMLGATWVS